MMPDSLLAAIRAVPMRCADCGMTTTTQDPLQCPESKGAHAWETDDAAIARVVREWLREHEPPRDAVIRALWEACGGPSRMPADPKMSGPMADAIHALYRRAWQGGR